MKQGSKRLKEAAKVGKGNKKVKKVRKGQKMQEHPITDKIRQEQTKIIKKGKKRSETVKNS